MTIDLVETDPPAPPTKLDLEPKAFAALVEHYLNTGVPFTCIVDHEPSPDGGAPCVNFTIRPEGGAGLAVSLSVWFGASVQHLHSEMILPVTTEARG